MSMDCGHEYDDLVTDHERPGKSLCLKCQQAKSIRLENIFGPPDEGTFDEIFRREEKRDAVQPDGKRGRDAN